MDSLFVNRHFGRSVISRFLCLSGFLLAAIVAGQSVRAAQSALPPAATVTTEFERDIEPLLSSHCYSCHGPKKQESGLRLDVKADALKGGDHGKLVVPGHSSESLIVQVTAGVHTELAAMPKKGERLSNPQIGLLRAWIDQGARWPDSTAAAKKSNLDHWAWRAPVSPSLPVTKDKNWAKTPIDRFVLAKLEREGVRPSTIADKTTLLRRLSFDLTGLPPTPSEVDRFVADRSPDAYERKVEELLNSAHYGERWGRHWLDAARYADSDGFEKDKPRSIWLYRDWVVGALNRDLTYDQFIIEQVAGDLLPSPTQDQLVATGFLRNSMLNEEGGVDPEQFRMDAMFDRMDCIGKSILGITIQCCQCHNHKFDPIKQEEYYRLFAYLNNDHESSMLAYLPADLMKRANLSREMRDIEEGLRHTHSDWELQMRAWEASVVSNQPPWEVVKCTYNGENGERFYYYDDGSIRAASYAPTMWSAHFRGTNRLASIGAFRFEQLTDPNLPCNGPGRSLKGMAALSEFTVEAIDASVPTNKMEVKLVKATADFSHEERALEKEFDDQSGKRRPYGPVAMAIDGKDDTAWGIDAGPGRRNQPRKAVFVPEKPITFTNGAVLVFKLMQNHGGWNSDDNMNHNLGRFRISVCGDTNAVADPLPAGVREIVGIPWEKRSPAQIATVFSYWRTTVPEFKEANEKIESLWRQWPEPVPSLTLVARHNQLPGDERRETHLLKRGDWLKPGDPVTAGVPAILHPMPAGADDSRLSLARWLVDRKSPTTARVCVNRTWQQYFGIGIVDTAEDLGTQSPAPSHPELLDWLACEFMEPRTSAGAHDTLTPWSMKHLHRLIVNSAAYKQSSHVPAELYQRDPYNRLLARAPRLRVEGEIVRDIALASSGLLNDEIGGRPAYPPAPEFLFQPPASYGPKTWLRETGSQRYRRGLYTFRFRSIPYPIFAAFDAPNGDFSCVRRLRSNTPLQALISLNEPVFMECAQALARKTINEGGASDQDRIKFAFRRVIGRPPTEHEIQALNRLREKEARHISEGWVSAGEVATGKNEAPTDLPPGITPVQLASYTMVCRTILNLDEAITRE